MGIYVMTECQGAARPFHPLYFPSKVLPGTGTSKSTNISVVIVTHSGASTSEYRDSCEGKDIWDILVLF